MKTERQLEIFQYRAGLAAGGAVYAFFGWYSEAFLNTPYDTLIKRAPLVVAAWLFFLLSFKFRFVLDNLRFCFLGCACSVGWQYIGIFNESNYHFYFSIGLMAMPSVAFTFFFHAIDIVVYYCFLLLCGILIIDDFNSAFIAVYLILSVLVFCVYVFVTKSRINLLREVKDNFQQIKIQKFQIEEKNRSLIRIGELAAQVAHDIRSPVTALEAVSELLGSEVDPKKKKLIENAAKRINDIANNLVSEFRETLTNDLSSIKFDRTIDLNSLIEDVIEEKKLSLDSRHKINFIAPESISTPEKLDPIDFQRVISNLINNSVEAFDKANGFVNITLTRSSENIQIVVQDNGRGISPANVDRIFNKGITTKPKGAGLGLSHAKQYVESIGGAIYIESILGSETKVIVQI